MKIWFNPAGVELAAVGNANIIQQFITREGSTEEEKIDKMMLLVLRKKYAEGRNIEKPVVKKPKEDIIAREREAVDIKSIISKVIISSDRVKQKWSQKL